jgi:hypothetical protein
VGAGGDRVETQLRWITGKTHRWKDRFQARKAAGCASADSRWEAQAEQRDSAGVSVTKRREAGGCNTGLGRQYNLVSISPSFVPSLERTR